MTTWLPKPGFSEESVGLTQEQMVKVVLMDEPRKATKCKHCGKGNLQWVQYKAKTHNGWADKWVLLGADSSGNLFRHKCEEFSKSLKEKF